VIALQQIFLVLSYCSPGRSLCCLGFNRFGRQWFEHVRMLLLKYASGGGNAGLAKAGIF
jgi:hypothetical protein